jgi:DNA polymerase III gamma/tau subunit
VPSEVFFDYADLVLAGDGPGLMGFLARLFESGYDHIEFYSGMVQHFRNLLVLEVSGRESRLSLLPDEVERMMRQAESFGRADLLRILCSITQYESQAATTRYPRVLLEVMSLELALGRSGSTGAGPGRDATTQNCDTPAAGDQPTTMNTLWVELRLRTNVHRPMLAGFLELATPMSLGDDTLTISLPAKHRAAAEKLDDNLKHLNATLAEVTGRPTKLAIQLTKKPGPDPTRERVSRILGEVDEKEQR